MNAKKGEYTGILDTVTQVLKHDKLGIIYFIIFNHKDKKCILIQFFKNINDKL